MGKTQFRGTNWVEAFFTRAMRSANRFGCLSCVPRRMFLEVTICEDTEDGGVASADWAFKQAMTHLPDTGAALSSQVRFRDWRMCARGLYARRQ